VQESRADENRSFLAVLNNLSLAPTYVGEVIVYPIASDKITKFRDLKPVELEQRYDRDRFDLLVLAAERYLSAGRDRHELTPSRVAMLALIPRSWVVDDDVYTKNGLILGPWKNDRIQVGVVGSYEALKPLIADYRCDAAEAYFPFPRPLTDEPKGNTFMRKLVLIFDRTGLQRAAHRALSELPPDEVPRGLLPVRH
jgi:hypothetical protein